MFFRLCTGPYLSEYQVLAQKKKYSPNDVIDDIKRFFTDANHWAYRYGDPTPECNPDSPYHRRQIEVIFESEGRHPKYDHWDVNNAVDNLVEQGFLKLKSVGMANFVVRSNVRFYKREMKRRLKIINQYAHPTITSAVGNLAEKLAEYMFRLNGFEILDRHTNQFQGKKWTKTNEDLDLIVGKDFIAFGVEVKNTLSYMEADEFLSKLEMCKFLNLVPLWVLRNAPEVQFNTIKAALGLILAFRTQMYPYGQEPLVKAIWNKMRLPVSVRYEMPQKIVDSLIRFHKSVILA